MRVEAILDRQADDISLDHLSRLLVDLHQDSSQIMSDLLSQYQRSLLDLVFLGDMNMRNKVLRIAYPWPNFLQSAFTQPVNLPAALSPTPCSRHACSLLFVCIILTSMLPII